MKIEFGAAMAALLVLAACGSNRNEAEQSEGGQSSAGAENMATTTPAANDPGNGMAAAAPGLPGSGQEYATMAAASDLFEIESSRLAQQKGQNAELKSFAQMLITNHERSTTDLKARAQGGQPTITVTPVLNPEQQANIQALQAANGAEFDRLYIQQQIPAHEKALAMVQAYAQNGDVPGLKQHAQTVSAPIQQHLERARQLQQQMSGGQQ